MGELQTVQQINSGVNRRLLFTNAPANYSNDKLRHDKYDKLGACNMKDRRWFGIVLACTFLVLLVLNFLTPMLADDYIYLYSFETQVRITSVKDIFQSMVAHATIMNGRVIPHFFNQLFLMLPSPIFKSLNACIYILFLLGIYRLVREDRASYDWKLLLIIDGALFLLPPVFGQTYLWQTGSLSYLWRDALMVWVFGTFANAVYSHTPVKGVGKMILLALASLYICNATENGAVGILFMMLICVIWLATQKRQIPPALFVCISFGVCGMLISLFSPSGQRNLHTLVSDIGIISDNYQRSFSIWLSNALWPSVAYIALFFAAAISQKPNRDRLAFSMGLFLASLVCCFTMTMASYYPLRAMVISINLIIIASVMVMTEIHTTIRLWLTRALTVSFALALTLQVFSALPYAYNRYKMNQERSLQILEQHGNGEKDITTFGILGKSRYDAFFDLHELTDDPTYSVNVYFAKYYDLRSIAVDRYEK